MDTRTCLSNINLDMPASGATGVPVISLACQRLVEPVETAHELVAFVIRLCFSNLLVDRITAVSSRGWRQNNLSGPTDMHKKTGRAYHRIKLEV